MTAIARDAVAAAHLVYAWPFPIGPDCEVACAEDENVVMCPAWLVGERLGPGRHHWRTPDPTRPSTAYFVLTAPVEVPFAMITTFQMPATGQRVRLHAAGSVQVRCADAQLLVAQFVGLPFDDVNAGILRSVSRSVERMLARLLIRRAVLASTAGVVTDPANQPAIVEELVAYNPAAGAVFGVEMIRMGHLAIQADDGSAPLKPFGQTAEGGRGGPNGTERPTAPVTRRDDIPLLETVRGRPASLPPPIPKPEYAPIMTTIPPPSVMAMDAPRRPSAPPGAMAMPGSGEVKRKITPLMGVPEMATSSPKSGPTSGPVVRATPSSGSPIVSSSMSSNASGEIGRAGVRPTAQSMPAVSIAGADDPTPPPAVPPSRSRSSTPTMSGTPPGVSGEIEKPDRVMLAKAAREAREAQEAQAAREAKLAEDARVAKEALAARAAQVAAQAAQAAKAKDMDVTAPGGLSNAPDRKANGTDAAEARGSIMGIGMSAIGEIKGGASVTGEIPTRVAPGARVLVPGPNGLMQSATVRQLLQGYYELEVGSTGQTIWVPMGGVVPDP